MADAHSTIQLWSPTQGATLTALARAAGWTVAETHDGFDPSAAIVVVDARHDAESAERRMAISPAPILLVLANDTTPTTLEKFYDAGATQVATVDATGAGLVQALRFAERNLLRPLRDRRGARTSGSRSAGGWIATHLAAGTPLTVIHVALVRFDLVNMAHGRSAATQLAEAAERRIAGQVSALADEEGLVARVPGAGIIAAVVGPAERAILLAARIEEALASPLRIGEAQAVIGTRIGIAGARPGDTAAGLIARAASELPSEATTLPSASADEGEGIEALAVDVHLALVRGEVRLRFQPQATIDTGTLVGVEALARWEHPRLGWLGAGTLLAAAERAGLGLALSDHIQRAVLDCASAWPPALSSLRLSLNLTAGDLARPNFADSFLAHVDASGFPRGRLTLEVTETGLMADIDAAAGLLAEFRGAGCRVAIDDFGTGYSSLAYLKALPIDYLKIDKSLAQDITGTDRDRVVVRGAIDMARSLGIAVIAEGVETEEQRTLLAAAGCALYQGYLFAEPLDEPALIALVEAARSAA